MSNILTDVGTKVGQELKADRARITSIEAATTPEALLTSVKTVDGAGSGLDADLLDGQHGSFYAPLASPALTGTPTAPTAAVGTNTTQVATTAFVNAEIANDAPTKTGTGASGTWGISVTGNAGTVTNGVYTTGDQTVAGVKTFSSSPIVPKPNSSGQVARYNEIGAMKGQSVVSANTTLSEASHGNTIIVNITSGITITMPAPNAVSAGTVFEIHGQSYTLNMNGNNTDFGGSFSVSASEVFRLISDGSSFYRIVRSSSKSGVAPNKLVVTNHSYNVIYQAAVNTYLQIWLQGTFMNSARINSGSTTALGDIIAKAGNDTNSNIWSQSITAIIPAGYYFRFEDDPDVASGNGWEVVSMRSYPLV